MKGCLGTMADPLIWGGLLLLNIFGFIALFAFITVIESTYVKRCDIQDRHERLRLLTSGNSTV